MSGVIVAFLVDAVFVACLLFEAALQARRSEHATFEAILSKD